MWKWNQTNPSIFQGVDKMNVAIKTYNVIIELNTFFFNPNQNIINVKVVTSSWASKLFVWVETKNQKKKRKRNN